MFFVGFIAPVISPFVVVLKRCKTTWRIRHRFWKTFNWIRRLRKSFKHYVWHNFFKHIYGWLIMLLFDKSPWKRNWWNIWLGRNVRFFIFVKLRNLTMKICTSNFLWLFLFFFLIITTGLMFIYSLDNLTHLNFQLSSKEWFWIMLLVDCWNCKLFWASSFKVSSNVVSKDSCCGGGTNAWFGACMLFQESWWEFLQAGLYVFGNGCIGLWLDKLMRCECSRTNVGNSSILGHNWKGWPVLAHNGHTPYIFL